MNVALTNVQTPAAQERAKHIIEAATAVMSRKGYDGTSMKDIAHEAGVAQGLIHYYFGSKEDLLLAVVRNLNDQMLTDISAALVEREGVDPLMQTWAAMQTVRDLFAPRSDTCRLFFDLITLSFTNERLREEVASLYEDLTAAATELFHEMAQKLPTPLPIPEEEFAAILVATIDGVLLRNAIDPEFGRDRLFRGLAFLWTSSGAMSYYLAGEQPPLEAFEQIVASVEPASPAVVEGEDTDQGAGPTETPAD
jgi:AcrR family transcriptional regulator